MMLRFHLVAITSERERDFIEIVTAETEKEAHTELLAKYDYVHGAETLEVEYPVVLYKVEQSVSTNVWIKAKSQLEAEALAEAQASRFNYRTVDARYRVETKVPRTERPPVVQDGPLIDLEYPELPEEGT
jgi:hypothetical protein